ncbi:MAG: threonine ammonia-lyase, partial [Chloroflexi bacterium]|nr:threonine ammonia-lyase [Chloroflexota bacterium]
RPMLLADIQLARSIVQPYIERTPVMAARTLGEMGGCRLLLKAENLQKTGSFKIRGATVRIARLTSAERARGVIAASAGNHAQGVALAASLAGIPCTIVMPRGASLAKVQATRGYGATIIQIGETYDEAQAQARLLAQERGATLVHAFDDEAIIAGQGTLGLEVLEQAPETETVLVPVGGGGLIAGMALAIKETRPDVRVVGVQAEASPAAAHSLAAGQRVAIRPQPTLADGIAVGQPGEVPFALIQRYVDEIVTVTEEAIAHSMVLLLERAKLLVEGAGAAPVAAVLSDAAKVRGQTVLALLSGGNVDPHLLPKVLEHGLAHGGRLALLRVLLLDRPGCLAPLLDLLAEAEVNILDVVHHRQAATIPPGQVEVEVTVETRDSAHATEIARLLRRRGYLPLPEPRRGEAGIPASRRFASAEAAPPQPPRRRAPRLDSRRP